ncbi:phasin family protein [Methylobacterium sp. BTF04]|nr:phasin family protein [Methylobacterium sp. BTF04]
MQMMLKSVEAVSKTAQTAGIEWADFAKQSLQHSATAMRELAKARDPKTALQIQAEYLKGSYERMTAQAKFIGELYSGLAKDMTKDLAKGAPAGVTLPAIA